MPNDETAKGLAGLLEWAEPIIFDRLLEAYRARVGAGAASWGLARLHARAWRAAIGEDFARFDAARRDLGEALAQSSLGEADVAKADAEIIVELLDIILAGLRPGSAQLPHNPLTSSERDTIFRR